MSAGTLNVNVACLACDGTRPCAQCRAVGRALAGVGHRVHRSSRYAALRAAEDGTYGFSAVVTAIAPGERAVADAIIALLPDAHVAIATDDVSLLPPLPDGFVAFPSADFVAGRLPGEWLDLLTENREYAPSSENRVIPSTRSDATRRLRAFQALRQPEPANARAALDDELAWYRASGIGFAVIVAHVGRARIAQARLALEKSVRVGDVVTLDGEAVAIILPGAGEPDAAALVKRTIQAVGAERGRKPEKMRAGVALCPRDGDDASTLLAAASKDAKS